MGGAIPLYIIKELIMNNSDNNITQMPTPGSSEQPSSPASPSPTSPSPVSPSPANPSPAAPGPAHNTPGGQAPYPAPGPTPIRPGGVPYAYQPPYYSYQPREKQPFTITDVYIIIGFVLSILGVFTYAVIFLPAGIAFSIVGFVKRTNVRTLGLSVAGIVVGVVACFIRIFMILHDLGLIPDWLSSGIFY